MYYPTLYTSPLGILYSVGGSWKEGSSSDSYSADVARFNGGRFDRIGILELPRTGHGVAEIRDELLIVVCGADNNKNAVRSCEFIDAQTGLVTPGPSTELGHSFMHAVSVLTSRGRGVVVAGGYGGNNLAVTQTLVEILEDPCEVSSRLDLIGVPGQLTTVGSAQQKDSSIELTGSRQWAAGALWLKRKINVGEPFDSHFSFVLS